MPASTSTNAASILRAETAGGSSSSSTASSQGKASAFAPGRMSLIRSPPSADHQAMVAADPQIAADGLRLLARGGAEAQDIKDAAAGLRDDRHDDPRHAAEHRIAGDTRAVGGVGARRRAEGAELNDLPRRSGRRHFGPRTAQRLPLLRGADRVEPGALDSRGTDFLSRR